jgi:MerR family transcriptional regulator, light-induced transcriptional regulator
MEHVQYSIKAAARRSGLSPHVIRVWERRYGAVEPERTGTNRRMYSEAEIERLSLMRHAIVAGHRISQIARLSAEQLKGLLGEMVVERTKGTITADKDGDAAQLGEECLEAIRRMDPVWFEEVLTRSLLVLGHQGLLQRVVGPLATRLGECWQAGELTAAHEHFASATLRVFLAHSARPFAQGENAPCLVVGTPVGQLHELGAVMISSAAVNAGWRVAYLGVSLPAAEIAGAARRKGARAVALSVVYPGDDPGLRDELVRMRQLLPLETRMIVGGRAARSYAEALREVGALVMEDLSEFFEVLDEVRKDGGGGGRGRAALGRE